MIYGVIVRYGFYFMPQSLLIQDLFEILEDECRIIQMSKIREHSKTQ
jgi:hypothetical protein